MYSGVWDYLERSKKKKITNFHHHANNIIIVSPVFADCDIPFNCLSRDCGCARLVYRR